MKSFFESYQSIEKLAPLVREIAWSHNIVIMERCQESLEREFYIRMTRKFGWSKNVLIHQIENQSYEKSLLGQNNFAQALTPELRAQALTRLFDHRHRIVFWYDEKHELRDEFEGLSLPGEEEVELTNNEYGIKYRILLEQPEHKLLLYREGQQPADLENWLLDVHLAHGEFRTKLTSHKNHLEAVSISASSSQGEKTKALKKIVGLDAKDE